MPEYPENIEAKLIAYIEGELDAAGRAEIEEYLSANPSYRKLIDELNRTRDFVGGLPRAKAPVELVETLQGQLERSVLLEGTGQESNTLQIRTARWPQFVSIAAVVLLAVGLGTVVYLALPHDTNGPELARRPESARSAATTEPTTISTVKAVPDAGEAAGELKRAPMPVLKSAVPEAPASPVSADRKTASDSDGNIVKQKSPAQMSASAQLAGKSAADLDKTEIAAKSQVAHDFASQKSVAAPAVAESAEVPPGAIYLIGNTANVPAADARVTSYLTTNGIWFKQLTADFGLPDPVQLALGKEPQSSLKNSLFFTKQSGDVSITNGPATRPETLTDANPATLSGTSISTTRGNLPSTNPSFGQTKIIPAPMQAPRDVSGSVGHRYLVRGLSEKQFTQLRSSMTTDSDSVKVVRLSVSLPTIKAGDELDVEVKELVGPGVEKSNRVQVAADGRISMPMLIDPLPAAGLTAPQLADAVAKRYRDALLIELPTVSVRLAQSENPTTAPSGTPSTLPTIVPTVEPTSQPDNAISSDVTAATTLPASQPAIQTTVTTAPAASAMTLSAAAATVDVVVVIHTAPPATLPTTTPASDDLPPAVEDATKEQDPATTQPTNAPDETNADEPAPIAPATLPATQPTELAPSLPATTQAITP